MFKLFKAAKLAFQVKSTIYVSIIRKMSSEIAKVTVRSAPDEPAMQVSFIYTDDHVNRRFNLNRKKDEEIGHALARIRSNIITIYEKKVNKKSKKATKVDQATSDTSSPTPELKVPELMIKLQHGDLVLPENTINTDAWIEGATLTVGSNVYKVLYNAPIVKSISLPKSIMAGYPVYPKLDLEFNTEEATEYDWSRSVVKKEIPDSDHRRLTMVKTQYWQSVGSHFFYVPSNDDIGKLLRLVCTPGCNGVKGLSEEAISPNKVEANPGECPFETRHLYTKDLTIKDHFRFVSYNILADLYADSDHTRTVLFPYCPPYALEIDYRKQLFLKEIIGYNADLICLQEVDRKIFYGDLNPILKSVNFDGVFNLKGGQVAEGLATFYRKSKFSLLENEAIILADYLPTDQTLADISSTVNENDKLKERVLARTTALQWSLLQSVENETNHLLVGNTHLYFHPDADHIRLLQASMCIRFLEEKLKILKISNPDKNYSLILCGDFNSTPEWGVYRLMTTGRVPKDIIDWQSNIEEAVTNLEVSHGLSLDSACGCPDYTNYTSGFQGCLDYIFYDKSKLEVTEVIPMPTHEEVTQNVAIPNINFPSDHIAIGCTLKWSN